MAPEQRQARHDLVGPPTDVYAIGAILDEMLIGRRAVSKMARTGPRLPSPHPPPDPFPGRSGPSSRNASNRSPRAATPMPPSSPPTCTASWNGGPRPRADGSRRAGSWPMRGRHSALAAMTALALAFLLAAVLFLGRRSIRTSRFPAEPVAPATPRRAAHRPDTGQRRRYADGLAAHRRPGTRRTSKVPRTVIGHGASRAGPLPARHGPEGDPRTVGMVLLPAACSTASGRRSPAIGAPSITWTTRPTARGWPPRARTVPASGTAATGARADSPRAFRLRQLGRVLAGWDGAGDGQRRPDRGASGAPPTAAACSARSDHPAQGRRRPVHAGRSPVDHRRPRWLRLDLGRHDRAPRSASTRPATSRIEGMDLSPDGSILATAASHEVTLWDFPS